MATLKLLSAIKHPYLSTRFKDTRTLTVEALGIEEHFDIEPFKKSEIDFSHYNPVPRTISIVQQLVLAEVIGEDKFKVLYQVGNDWHLVTSPIDAVRKALRISIHTTTNGGYFINHLESNQPISPVTYWLYPEIRVPTNSLGLTTPIQDMVDGAKKVPVAPAGNFSKTRKGLYVIDGKMYWCIKVAGGAWASYDLTEMFYGKMQAPSKETGKQLPAVKIVFPHVAEGRKWVAPVNHGVAEYVLKHMTSAVPGYGKCQFKIMLKNTKFTYAQHWAKDHGIYGRVPLNPSQRDNFKTLSNNNAVTHILGDEFEAIYKTDDVQAVYVRALGSFVSRASSELTEETVQQPSLGLDLTTKESEPQNYKEQLAAIRGKVATHITGETEGRLINPRLEHVHQVASDAKEVDSNNGIDPRAVHTHLESLIGSVAKTEDEYRERLEELTANEDWPMKGNVSGWLGNAAISTSKPSYTEDPDTDKNPRKKNMPLEFTNVELHAPEEVVAEVHHAETTSNTPEGVVVTEMLGSIVITIPKPKPEIKIQEVEVNMSNQEMLTKAIQGLKSEGKSTSDILGLVGSLL